MPASHLRFYRAKFLFSDQKIGDGRGQHRHQSIRRSKAASAQATSSSVRYRYNVARLTPMYGGAPAVLLDELAAHEPSPLSTRA